MGKCFDCTPYLRIQDAVVLRAMPLEALKSLTKFSEIRDTFSTIDIPTEYYNLRIFCPYLTAETSFQIKFDSKKSFIYVQKARGNF